MSNDLLEKVGSICAFLVTWLGIFILVVGGAFIIGRMFTLPIHVEIWHEVIISFFAKVFLYMRN